MYGAYLHRASCQRRCPVLSSGIVGNDDEKDGILNSPLGQSRLSLPILDQNKGENHAGRLETVDQAGLLDIIGSMS